MSTPVALKARTGGGREKNFSRSPNSDERWKMKARNVINSSYFSLVILVSSSKWKTTIEGGETMAIPEVSYWLCATLIASHWRCRRRNEMPKRWSFTVLFPLWHRITNQYGGMKHLEALAVMPSSQGRWFALFSRYFVEWFCRKSSASDNPNQRMKSNELNQMYCLAIQMSSPFAFRYLCFALTTLNMWSLDRKQPENLIQLNSSSFHTQTSASSSWLPA